MRLIFLVEFNSSVLWVLHSYSRKVSDQASDMEMNGPAENE